VREKTRKIISGKGLRGGKGKVVNVNLRGPVGEITEKGGEASGLRQYMMNPSEYKGSVGENEPERQ